MSVAGSILVHVGHINIKTFFFFLLPIFFGWMVVEYFRIVRYTIN